MTVHTISTSAVLDSHLVQLTGDWVMWRSACLRSAGFPIEHVLTLAASASTAIVLERQRADEDEARSRTAVLDAIRDELRLADREARAELNRARKDLQRGRLPRIEHPSPRMAGALDEHARSAQRRADLDRAVHDSVARDLTEQRAVLRERAGDPRFHEAMVWQNRHAAGRVHSHVLSGIDASARGRRDELLVASYVQRFCTKNETIGFFGPLCWIALRPDHAGMTITPGRRLVRDPFVQFETWALDAVAKAWTARFGLKRWLPPRRVPVLRVDGQLIVKNDGTTEPLSVTEAAALRLADGARTADAIARQLLAGTDAAATAVEEVFGALETLEARGCITWRFELPFVGQERALDDQARAIGDPGVRDAVLDEWRTLRAARQAVTQAAGDAATVDAALEQAEQTFTQIAGVPPTRHQGQAYGSRTILRHECSRDVDVAMGDDVVASCAEPLALLLASASWLSSHVAQRLSSELDAIYDELPASASGTVDAVAFWLALFKRWPAFTASVSGDVAELHDRWRQVFGPLPPGSSVRYTAASLRPAVDAAFAGPRVPSSYCRYVSVDLQIAAQNLEDLNLGRRLHVLGEIHVGNLLDAGLFVEGHPDRSVLRAHMDADCPETRVILVRPRTWPTLSARFSQALPMPRDVLLFVEAESHGAYAERTVPIADCIVERCDGRLMLRRRTGAPVASLAEAFRGLLAPLAAVPFSPFAEGDHVPRVTIDNLVIARESWRLELPLECLRENDTARGVIALNEWRLARGLPRWCFVRIKTERKPMYVDFDSAILSALLLATVRRVAAAGASTMTVSEMLPDPTHLWLQDREGLHYTSELRLVTVDRSSLHTR
jgi:hypothetical protein